IIRQSSIIGIISLGMTCVILTSGIDLSVGSILAISTLIAASLVKDGAPFLLAWLAALAVGGLGGLVNGVIVAFLDIPPFIVTLGMMGIARGLSLLYTNGAPITGFPYFFRFLGASWIGSVPTPVLIFFFSFMLFYVLLDKTVWGQQVRCVGSNPTAAILSGVNVKAIVTSVYVLSGISSALAGLILVGRLDSAQPTAGLGYEFGAIAAVVLGGTQFTGGKGRLLGTVLGVLIIGMIENGINILDINPFYEQVVKGGVIAAALIAYGRLAGVKAKEAKT
ncbi:MAG: ABC transporter permease, partial [Synergistetes bacterium]|nr:ABC transporter permease [Synergistota bacterium]